MARLLRLHEISANNLAQDAANRLRQNQIRGAIDQMRVFLAGNTLFAPILSFQAWNMGNNLIVLAWTTALLTFSWILFFRWNNSYQTDGSVADMQTFVAETRVNAALWCLGMILFYPVVTGEGKTIVITVMTGSLALGTVGFAQAPRAAFWYLAIQSSTLVLVPLCFGLYWNSGHDLLIAALAVLASLAIFNTVLEWARSQMTAFINHEALSQKSEVIDLLLKDYEEQGVEWAWRTDAQGHIQACPQQVVELVAPGPGRLCDIVLLDALARNCDLDRGPDMTKVTRAFAEQREFHDVVLPIYTADTGNIRWIMMRGRPQFDGSTFAGFRGIFVDATAGIEAKMQVTYLAENDQLTGVQNRNFVQRLLEELDPRRDRLTMYLIDLDGFKQVNDSYGHACGDKLLKLVAERLTKVIGPDGTVARLGGDEFLVLTDKLPSHQSLAEITLSNRMLETLSTAYCIDRYDITLSASIGTAHYPDDTDHGPSLLNLADLALYSAKQNGRNMRIAFRASMKVGLQKRLVIMDRLKRAVERDEIKPFYQSQYCAQTQRLVGFEALARWDDNELGMVGPDIFIPIAEETGLIHDIGASLLKRACLDALTWTTPEGAPDLTISVNLSPVQVKRGGILELVKATLKDTGLPAHRLEIEVTEGVLIEDMVGTSETLSALSDLGVSIALDDFGTGYSSLSYLRALPLQRLKIDRSFIYDIADPEAQSVVQTIIDLGRRLKLEVIAEGVETSQSAKLLGEMQCDVLQGYLFSRPVPAEDVLSLLEPSQFGLNTEK